MKIALVGNPNCGKTTMFNALTGSSQYVGNWPGVTVEKKEGQIKGKKGVIVTDLPGIYSLSPYTPEEVVSRNYLVNEKPDVIINIVDGTNLERNLYLTTQVLELGIPVVIALNMIDILRKSGSSVDLKKLERSFGCQVVETSASKGIGIQDVVRTAEKLASEAKPQVSVEIFDKQLETTLSQIASLLGHTIEDRQKRWFSVKLFERDEKVSMALQLSEAAHQSIEALIQAAEKEQGDDSETIITNERYDFIGDVVSSFIHRGAHKLTASDRIDKIVTNRFLAIPIFLVIIWFVYYISVTTIGSTVTDWTNDTLFGDWITSGATTLLTALGTAKWLNSLIVDGIINGVGTVLGFVPQMLILFFFLSILEDSGYMARIAFIMDRMFRRFGLSGKSFIPILISSGCGVPGIMSTRTIESEKDRRMTIMLTTFIPCSAKVTIITMIVTIFFPKSTWIAPVMYLLGIAVIAVSGIILKKTRLFAGEPEPFVMELPAYRIPSLKGVLIHMWERSKHFIFKAGTIIFLACTLIWFLSSYNWRIQMVGNIENSMLANVGHALSWFFSPLGFGTWKGAVASISALMAKENAIGTLAVLNGLSDDSYSHALAAGITSMFTPLAAFSFMLFNLFNPPCIVAMSTTSREMNSKGWTFIAIGYQMLLGYAMAFTANQLGGVLFYGKTFGVGPIIALVLIAIVIFLLIRPAYGSGGWFRRGVGVNAQS
ncbi:MAG: ferrous iron transport protein B [Sporolactobacillus sp.]